MTVEKKIKSENLLEWLFLFLAVTDTLAFLQGDTTLRLSFLHTPIIALKYLSIFAAFVIIFSLRKSLNYKYLWLPITIWLVHFFCSIDSNEIYSSPLNLLILSVFCLLPDTIKIGLLKKYRQWIIIMSIGGIIAYLSFILSLGLPYSIIDYYYSNYSSEETAIYIDYIFAVLYSNLIELRLCGLFNEPGYFATVIALILVVEDFNLKRIGNVIMLIAGIMAFSLAFYLILIAFFLTRMLKNVFTVMATIGVFLLLFSYIQNTQFENPQIQYFVDRFKIDEYSGKMSGDNRTSDDFELAYQRMVNEGDFFWGKGTNSMDGQGFKTSSWKSIIYRFGFFGFIVIVGGLFVASFPLAMRNRATLIFLFCFFISIYQRPNVFNLVYFNLLFGGILYLKNKNYESRHSIVSKTDL